ncbi:MAG: Penicillin-binding protein 2, partial [Actinomycetota bacterium]|nr:Penicillin-binding protein 2 [Actinomycetota bacterium]
DALPISSEEQPLLDRTIQAELAPASTFKPITATAAAEAGYDFSESYPCPAAYNVGTQAFTNYESSAYPPLTVADALKVSCNTVFYKFAAEMYAADGGLNPSGTPRELIPNTARAFGYGSATGVDLAGEASGKVTDRAQKLSDYEELSAAYCTRAETGYPEEPDPAKAEMYKQFAAEYCADGDKYRVGDAINQAVGQGDILVTPLQMARAYAAIGNGGTLYTPHVVKAVVGANGKVVKDVKPEVAGKLPDSPETLAYIQQALESVTTGGTAAPAFAGFPLDEIPVAAKTGTAEVANKETTSLFASYAPANNPRYAVVVVITQAGVGGEMSAPAARKIYDALFGVVDGKADPARSVLVGGAPQADLPADVLK